MIDQTKTNETQLATVGVWLNERTNKLFLSKGEEDKGSEISPSDLEIFYLSHRIVFFDAQKTMVWLRDRGVKIMPKEFECVVSQNSLTTSGVGLTIPDLVFYWWEDEAPENEAENSLATYFLDDSPDYETLREIGCLTAYMKRLGRIASFVSDNTCRKP